MQTSANPCKPLHHCLHFQLSAHASAHSLLKSPLRFLPISTLCVSSKAPCLFLIMSLLELLANYLASKRRGTNQRRNSNRTAGCRMARLISKIKKLTTTESRGSTTDDNFTYYSVGVEDPTMRYTTDYGITYRVYRRTFTITQFASEPLSGQEICERMDSFERNCGFHTPVSRRYSV